MSLSWMLRGRIQTSNVVTIVAWAGVGKSTLINHWLRGMAAEHYRSAQLVLDGRFIDKEAAGALRLQMNLSKPLSRGSVTRIHGSERHGRRAKDLRNLSHIGEPSWFWMASSRSRIRLVHKKDGYGRLPCRRFCASSRLSVRGFA